MAIVGVEGYTPAEFVSGTVRVLVTARAVTGVASTKLTSGNVEFAVSSTAAAPPLYAFDVDTTRFADGDLALTATVTAGDGSTGTASGTLHVDNELPTIASFTFQSGGTASTFAPGADVVLTSDYDARGGTATINDAPAGAPGATTTFQNIQSSTVYTLTVTSPSGQSISRSVTATVSAQITAFSVGTTQAASAASATISNGATTTLFASFAGRGSAPATLSCAPACDGTLAATTVSSGGSVTVTASGNGTLTYTLAVSPTSGPAATATVTVRVVPPANAIDLTAAPSVVHQGGSTTLTPVFNFGSSPAVPGTAAIVGSDGSTYANLSSGSSIQVAPTMPTTTYTLHVTNGAGAAAATAPTATVSVAPGTWSALNGNTFATLRGASVTALVNGKVLIAGGVDPSNNPVNTAYVCDATGLCAAKTAGAGMASPRAFHTAVVVGSTAPDNAGKVLLAGGYTANGPAAPTSSAEFYDPVNDTFVSTVAIAAGPAGARARHVAVLLDDRNLLIAGGTDGSVDLSTAITYDAGAATPVATSVSAMAQARAGFSATLLETGKVLIAGGAAGDVSAELFDPSLGAFSPTGALPAGEDKRSHTAVALVGATTNAGKVLISGGVTGAGAGTPSTTQFLYDPSSGTFEPIVSLMTARSNHAAIILPDTQVLICGGTSDGTDVLSSCELYDHTSGTGTQFPTAPMLEARRDFGLAPITISSVVEILAAGSPNTPMFFAETYNLN